MLSIIIPTYNEKDNVEILVSNIKRVLGKDRHEIIFVDDSSPDGTAGIIGKLAKKDSAVKLVRNPSKSGIGNAYRKGFAESKGDIIVTMDADLSHNPEHIPALLKAVRACDIAVGSRYCSGGRIDDWGCFRRFVSRTANAIARLFLGLRTRDLTTGFRAYRRGALEKISFPEMRTQSYAVQLETIWHAEKSGLKITEVPIVFTERKGGKSKLGPLEPVRFLLTVLRLFLRK